MGLQAGMMVQFEGHWNAMRQKETATRVVATGGALDIANGGGSIAAAGWAGDAGWTAAAGSGAGARQPTNHLLISGLPSGVSTEVIEAIFAPYGTVASLEVLPANGTPDVTARINFSDLEQAKWIRENLDQNMPVGLVSPLTIRYDDASIGGYGKATCGTGDARYSPYTSGGADFQHVSPSAPIMGIVKAWMEDRGMGFITPASGGPDVFVHRSDLLGVQSLVEGATVSYESSWDAQKNKALAKSVTLGPPNVAGIPPQGLPPQSEAQASWALQVQGGSEWKTGTVKAWIEERGMGFISPGDGGPDVFVHRSVLQDGLQSLEGITSVTFTPGWDPQKGKPIAAAVWAAAAPAAPAQVAWTAAPAAGAWAPPQSHTPVVVAPPRQQQAYPQAPPPGQQGEQTGVVKDWKNERGMGFIGPDNGGPDLFVHRSKLLDGEVLVVGSRVTFTADVDPMKGKPIAVNVSGAVAAGANGVMEFA